MYKPRRLFWGVAASTATGTGEGDFNGAVVPTAGATPPTTLVMLPALRNCPAALSSARPNASAVANRCSGFFAMAIRMMSLITGGSVGSIWTGGTGCEFKCAAMME
jgi:hypothetical protein